MERRTLATVRKQWPEIEAVAVTSPQLGLLEYPTPEISLNQVGSVSSLRRASGVESPAVGV